MQFADVGSCDLRSSAEYLGYQPAMDLERQMNALSNELRFGRQLLTDGSGGSGHDARSTLDAVKDLVSATLRAVEDIFVIDRLIFFELPDGSRKSRGPDSSIITSGGSLKTVEGAVVAIVVRRHGEGDYPGSQVGLERN